MFVQHLEQSLQDVDIQYSLNELSHRFFLAFETECCGVNKTSS